MGGANEQEGYLCGDRRADLGAQEADGKGALRVCVDFGMMAAENCQETERKMRRGISRRDFLASAAGVGLFTIVPAHVLGANGQTPPSEKLNIAGVGVGHQGSLDLAMLENENLVALCDVDWAVAAPTFEKYPNARKWRDFRKMLDEQKDIDAVLVATADHTHAVASMEAIKRGKHVYCEKPLTRTVFEARKLAQAAREHKAVTQMGIQVHGEEGMKIFVEAVRAGAIGKVREVHLWSNKRMNHRFGEGRPSETPPVPETLDWDLWLGPAAWRPYHPYYVPQTWRAWRAFGSGRLGDMGCHIFDPAFWALDLRAPVTVEAYGSEYTDETYPSVQVVRYEFASRGELPAVTLTWSHGGVYPWRPKELEEGRNLPVQGGLYIGDKGTILLGHQDGPRLLPEVRMKDFVKPEPTLPRGVDHYAEWAAACKCGARPSANFDYAGPLTEAVLLGNVALFAGTKIAWDAENMRITNVPQANEFLYYQYREGWTL